MKLTRLKLIHEGNLVELAHINQQVFDMMQRAKKGGYEPTEAEITMNSNKHNYLIELYAERRGQFTI